MPAFEAKLRVRERKHPKLYWVDAGVVRVAKQHRGPVAPEERGPLFEGIVATLLRAWNDDRGVYDAWAYWAPAEGAPVEVDFLLRRGKRFIAIEVKSSPRPRDDDRAGLDAIDGLPGLERRMLVYPRSATLRLHGGIEVFDLEAFEALVAAGKL